MTSSHSVAPYGHMECDLLPKVTMLPALHTHVFLPDCKIEFCFVFDLTFMCEESSGLQISSICSSSSRMIENNRPQFLLGEILLSVRGI